MESEADMKRTSQADIPPTEADIQADIQADMPGLVSEADIPTRDALLASASVVEEATSIARRSGCDVTKMFWTLASIDPITVFVADDFQLAERRRANATAMVKRWFKVEDRLGDCAARLGEVVVRNKFGCFWGRPQRYAPTVIDHAVLLAAWASMHGKHLMPAPAPARKDADIPRTPNFQNPPGKERALEERAAPAQEERAGGGAGECACCRHPIDMPAAVGLRCEDCRGAQ